ncbi:DHA2 family efflux MFS transporter permease subunit [Zavarzinia sp. CC-PAN008]|uniref:DHA2 family efflux MFS transporter permease subunit n=1 Tax=Zavarzinia sp. CC-PAN008 TaxID=3243332 RepID=UPI003F749C34
MRDTAADGPGWRAWVGFLAMCTGLFMAVLDIQIVATALPEIQLGVGTTPDRISWVQTVYLIAEVVAIALTGLLTRMLGMARLFTLSILGFTAASIGCALSDTLPALLAWRTVQGAFAGTIIPSVFSAVFLIFPGRSQPLATTIAGLLAVLAPTLGPYIGGSITQAFSWHWLFLVNVVPGLLAAAVGWTALRRVPADWQVVRRLDWLALALLVVALASLELTVKDAPRLGWTTPASLVLVALLLGCGGLFVWRTLAAPDPIVVLRQLRDRDFALGCALSFLLGTGLYGATYLMPVFLAFVREAEPLRIGEVMLVTGIAQLVAAPLVVLAERVVGCRVLALAGFALFALGLGLSSGQTWQTDFWEMALPQAIRGVAIMLCLLPPTRIALGHLAPEGVPDASALFNLLRNLGGAVGIALTDTVIHGTAYGAGEAIAERLRAGDRATAVAVGLDPARFTGVPLGPVDQATQDAIRPLVERAALVEAINHAWAALAAFAVLGVLLVLLVRGRPIPPLSPGGPSGAPGPLPPH